jgi:hypothetical protein
MPKQRGRAPARRWVQDEEYRQLRPRLILVGKTVSQWVRRQIKWFLRGA